MAFTTADYPKLTQKLNEVFNEAASVEVSSWVGREIFDTPDTDWKTYDYLTLHGTGGFTRVAEGGQLPLSNSSEGDSAAWTQKRHGSRVGITKDMRMFDRYNEMEDLVKTEVEYAFDRIDQSMADVLTNGFTGTSYTDVYGETVSNLAVDGVVLFSASHTNNINSRTFRNLIRNSAGTNNPALSRDAIVTARKDGKIYRDPVNANRSVNLDTLIVSATNEDLAERVVFSSGVQGTPNVDLNPLKGKVSNIKVWSRLDVRSDGTDTSAYWFMADSKRVKKCLKSPFAQKPMMGEATQVHDSLTWEYPIDAYYVIGLGYPAYIYGSTGAN